MTLDIRPHYQSGRTVPQIKEETNKRKVRRASPKTKQAGLQKPLSLVVCVGRGRLDTIPPFPSFFLSIAFPPLLLIAWTTPFVIQLNHSTLLAGSLILAALSDSPTSTLQDGTRFVTTHFSSCSSPLAISTTPTLSSRICLAPSYYFLYFCFWASGKGAPDHNDKVS